MLKNLTALHTPELLHALAAMGHGDEIALVDAHFPAVSHATHRLIRLDGAALPEVLDACLTVIPLDGFVDDPAVAMAVVADPSEVPPVQRDCQAVIDRHEPGAPQLQRIPRHDFYARTRAAFAVVITGEQRPYGNVILKKGVCVPVATGR
ncbi:MAG: ribose ABC transporter [Rhodospirillales bacterium 20-64-7]|nr:MAG: ribose ABC transporter [Rhodospirillales bacterium 20-64-7]